MIDHRIIQYKSAGEACSKSTMDKWERERQQKIHDSEVALALWGDQGNPLDYIVESGGLVRHSSKVCERCGKRFRFYRKEHIVYDRKAHKFHAWKQVCIDCIDLEGDAF